MMKRNPHNLRLVITGMLLFLALHFPVIAFFSSSDTWFGVPQLLFYLFWVWVVVIVLIIRFTNNVQPMKRERDDE